LKGIQIVANALVWNDGYPLGGLSPLSRWFDDLPLRTGLWFQAGGNTHGQSWTGLYRDIDKSGVMEFADAGTPLPRERWTRELNFLGWQPYEGTRAADLPAGARVRVSMQWREPHDAHYYARPGEEDLYRRPLASLRLVLLRQRDPQGKQVSHASQACPSAWTTRPLTASTSRLSSSPWINLAAMPCVLNGNAPRTGCWPMIPPPANRSWSSCAT
jgi:hypothetical protein